MSRAKLIRTNLYPYHVTTRTNNKEWFDIPLDEVWKMALHSLSHANDVYPVDIISFVLMNNHYHLILKTPDSNLDLFMYEFNKRLSLLIRSRSNRVNSVFGGRYKWCLIQNQTYLYNCYRYVYQNPIRAKIVERCEDYQFSTLHYLTQNKIFPVAIYDAFGFKDQYALYWLNQNVSYDEIDAIRKSLRQTNLDGPIVLRQSRRKIESFDNAM